MKERSGHLLIAHPHKQEASRGRETAPTLQRRDVLIGRWQGPLRGPLFSSWPLSPHPPGPLSGVRSGKPSERLQEFGDYYWLLLSLFSLPAPPCWSVCACLLRGVPGNSGVTAASLAPWFPNLHPRAGPPSFPGPPST